MDEYSKLNHCCQPLRTEVLYEAQYGTDLVLESTGSHNMKPLHTQSSVRVFPWSGRFEKLKFASWALIQNEREKGRAVRSGKTSRS